MSSQVLNAKSPWEGRSVFITGHTGFKGSWLTLYLTALGAQVTGFSNEVRESSLFHLAALGESLVSDERADVRDLAALKAAISVSQPSAVFHLAAQPLVRDSFISPVETFATNVMGTANTLAACNTVDSVRALVVVTTDKVYRNEQAERPFVEPDPLGGKDPYSASKAAAEFFVASFRESVARDSLAIATVRAGNVIGGGDDGRDRVVPDLVRAFRSEKSCAIRHPHSLRPWQHVLDPLRGYLLLGERLLDGSHADAWNFGPALGDQMTVSELADAAASAWGDEARWHESGNSDDREAPTLRLDSTRALDDLGWKCLLSQREAIAWTVQWEHEIAAGCDPATVSSRQLGDFLGRSR